MAFSVITRFLASDEKIFTSNIKYLLLVGLWPDENWSSFQLRFYKLYEVILHTFSVLYIIITGIGTYQNKDDIALLLSNLDKSLVSYNFVTKVVLFMLKRKQLQILITEIELSGDKVSEERKKLMRVHVIFVSVVSTAIVGAFCILALYKMEMAVEAWMPFDPMKNRMNLFLAAELSAVLFVIPCLYRSFAMQGIVCSIIMYMCDQLLDLQNRLRALQYVEENERAMRDEFKEIIKKHVRLMGNCKCMNIVFKEYFLVQNLAVTVELCLNAVMVSVVGLKDVTLLASFLAFLGIALLNAYIYCYLGHELILQSVGLSMAAYESDWITWPLDLQKDLLKFTMVAQKPLQLSAGGIATMSIQTFSQALYNGYSIFAVLNDVVD